MNFLGGKIRQGSTCNTLGAWDPERPIVMATEFGVTVEEALLDIVINYIKVMINVECYFLASLIMSLEKVFPTHSVYQWVE